MKRFYKDVAVTPERGLTLDGRAVRTPARALLTLPNDALAEAVADEWRAQGEEIDPRSMPMTGLANAAIDRVAPDPAAFAAPLSAYAESELLCYRAEEPPELAARQDAVWGPILDWARGRYDVSFTLVTGIMHQPQPPQTLTRLADAVSARSIWELAALNPMISISGSLVIALAVLESAVQPEAAFAAAHLDEIWQAELWGEDDWALDARAVRERDFLNACHFAARAKG
jgi:chaperone required for assembly of F1-ATPase